MVCRGRSTLRVVDSSSEHAFLTYLQNIFDAVDNDLGVESVAQPPPFVRLDQDVHEHFGGRRLTVVFIGNNVGVTSDMCVLIILRR